MKLEQGVKGDAEEDVFCFGSEIFENNENVNFTRLDEKTTDGLLKGLISGSRCVFVVKCVRRGRARVCL